MNNDEIGGETKDEDMTISLQKPDITELKPKITVFGVGGGGGNAVNNMITAGLTGVEFVVANTDAQALTMSKAERLVQLGEAVTEGLGAGSQPEIGAAAAEECIDEICDYLNGTHMCFVTAGMGGGTGTGAAPVVAKAAREKGILTVGVVTKPFHFEGARRMKIAEAGIEQLQSAVDTLIVIPNQNLFRIANDKTTFADAFGMADQVLYSGVACITDLMVKEGLINLDFADVRSVMREMGRAMMGTGEASGEGRAMAAAEAAISNPLLDETSMRGAQGLLISITGGRDLTLFEVDEAATRIREEVDSEANIILGATFDEELEGVVRVSVVATGIDRVVQEAAETATAPRSQVKIEAKPAAPAAVQTAPRQNVAPQAQNQQVQPQQRERVVKPQINRGSEQQAAQKINIAPTAASVQVKPTVQAPPSQQPEAAGAAPRKVQAEARMPEVPQSVRMPEVEDFPPIAQAELMPDGAHDTGINGTARSLLDRLTSGLSRKDNAPETGNAPTVTLRAAEPESRKIVAENEPSVYTQQPVTPPTRKAQTPPAVNADDELEIPAFLRRQAHS